MKRINIMGRCLFILLGFFVLTSSESRALDSQDTRLLSEPAISASRVAFSYAGDLWVAHSDGSDARRLTSHEGLESNPVFSPDGKLIAFDAQYDGNTDVYVVSSEGGVPKRLTWHPGADQVRGFTPDGSSVLFISAREVFTRRYTQLYTIPVGGGIPTRVNLPYAFRAAFSPDGSRIAYVPLAEAFHQWKRYRGGQHSVIWMCTLKDLSIEKIPQPEGRCNDTDPMWIGNKIYFRSDRNGEFNLFSFDLQSGEIDQLTAFTDFPVIRAASGADRIIFEQAGYLHIFHVESGRSERLIIGIGTDLMEVRARYVSGSRYIRSASLSPSGARAVMDFRGEIVTIPGEKGDPRNITNSPAVHERSPAWSPDGKSIAYFSDESGEYALHIRSQDGSGDIRKFPLSGAGFYTDNTWSPDGKKYVIRIIHALYTGLTWKKGSRKKSGQNTSTTPSGVYGECGLPIRIGSSTRSTQKPTCRKCMCIPLDRTNPTRLRMG